MEKQEREAIRRALEDGQPIGWFQDEFKVSADGVIRLLRGYFGAEIQNLVKVIKERDAELAELRARLDACNQHGG